MYHQFNTQQFYVLPKQYIMCFVWIWKQTAIISLQILTDWFYDQHAVCLLRGTEGIFLINFVKIFL